MRRTKQTIVNFVEPSSMLWLYWKIVHLDGGLELWRYGLSTDPSSSVLTDPETSFLEASHHKLYVRGNRHRIEVIREASLVICSVKVSESSVSSSLHCRPVCIWTFRTLLRPKPA